MEGREITRVRIIQRDMQSRRATRSSVHRIRLTCCASSHRDTSKHRKRPPHNAIRTKQSTRINRTSSTTRRWPGRPDRHRPGPARSCPSASKPHPPPPRSSRRPRCTRLNVTQRSKTRSYTARKTLHSCP